MTNIREYLQKPGRYLHVFDQAHEKIKILADKMLIGYLWLPDEMRNKDGILLTINILFPRMPEGVVSGNIHYEIGNFGGLLSVYSILPGYKCDLFLRLWDPSLWGATLVRDIRYLLATIMREAKVKRMAFQSPDERYLKLMKMIGFKVEGTQKNAFMFDGKLYTNYLYRKIREG